MRLQDGEIRIEKITEDHVGFLQRINQDVMPRKQSDGFFETFYQTPIAAGTCLAAVHYADDDSQYSVFYPDSERKRRVAGYVCAANNARGIFIMSIAVAKRFQRQGVGSMLIRSLVDRVGDGVLRTMPVPEGDGFAEAGLFFRKNGFVLHEHQRVRVHPGSKKIAFQGYTFNYKGTP